MIFQHSTDESKSLRSRIQKVDRCGAGKCDRCRFYSKCSFSPAGAIAKYSHELACCRITSQLGWRTTESSAYPMRESWNLLSFRPMILPLLLRTGISSTQPLSIYSSPWSAMSAANGREIGFSSSGKRYSPKQDYFLLATKLFAFSFGKEVSGFSFSSHD